MTPGAILTKTCPSCGHHVRQKTFASVNAYWSREWTDGFIARPMWPDTPRLVRCLACEQLFWLDEQAVIWRRWPQDPETEEDRAFSGALSFGRPLLDEYMDFLETHSLDARKEQYVRLQAWWTGNDPRRRWDEPAPPPTLRDRLKALFFRPETPAPSPQPLPLGPREITNLEALVVTLSDADAGERLYRAEALRELGQFDEATRLLDAPFDKELEPRARVIRRLSAQGMSTVACVP